MRVTKDGVHTDGDEGTRDPQKHRSGHTSAPASNVTASNVPRKRGLLRRHNGRWVDRQLHMTQDFLDDADLGNCRDDPQRALLTHRAAFHLNRKDPLEHTRPRPVRRGARAFGRFHPLLAWRWDDGRPQVAVRRHAPPVTHQMQTRQRH